MLHTFLTCREFCFKELEENDLQSKMSVLRYTVYNIDRTLTYAYLRPGFDKIAVCSLFGLVNLSKIKIEVEIILVPVVANIS